MILSEHVPSAPLNTYIKALRYSEGPTLYQHLKMLPSPALNLMINFDGAFNCHKPQDAKPYATYTESWSIGLWNIHHILDWPRHMQLLIVDFKPGGAYPFLHVPLSELHNDIVPLDAIWGNLAAEIRERLNGGPSIRARFGLFEQLLLTRVGDAPEGLEAVQYAAAEIARHHGALSIRSLAEDVGMSHNHLTRQFQQLVGATPKELARIYRFRYAISTLDHTAPIDWGQVASHAHYYDQAHFNKDFKTFTGYTPDPVLRRTFNAILKTTLRYAPGLFHSYDIPDLPRTNNDRESGIPQRKCIPMDCRSIRVSGRLCRIGGSAGDSDSVPVLERTSAFIRSSGRND